MNKNFLLRLVIVIDLLSIALVVGLIFLAKLSVTNAFIIGLAVNFAVTLAVVLPKIRRNG